MTLKSLIVASLAMMAGHQVLCAQAVKAPIKTWTGLAMVSGGGVEGQWRVSQAGAPGEDAIHVGSGKAKEESASVLVAPHSRLSGFDLVVKQSGQIRADKAEIRHVRITGGLGCMVHVSRSHLSDFIVAAGTREQSGFPGMSHAPILNITDSLVSGHFEIGSGEIPSPARIERTHFVKANLMIPSGQQAVSATLSKCHFEQCEIPWSWLIQMVNCTFEDCRFVVDVAARPVTGAGMVLEIVGKPGDLADELKKLNVSFRAASSPAVRFWSPWKEGTEGVVTTDRLSFGTIATAPLMKQSRSETIEAIAARQEGAVFLARGRPERLIFRKGMVEVQTGGVDKSGGRSIFGEDQKVSWAGSTGERSGWLSESYHALVMSQTFPMVWERWHKEAAVLDLSDAYAAGQLDSWLIGSTWEITQPAGKRWLRFETPGYCVWVDDKGSRGQSQWYPRLEQPAVQIKEWPGSTSGALFEWDLNGGALTVTCGDKKVSGHLRNRWPDGELAVLSPGESKASSAQIPGPARAPEPVPSAAQPAFKLGMQTSAVTAILPVQADGHQPLAAASYTMGAVVVPTASALDAPLIVTHLGNLGAARADLKHLFIKRHGAWPAGCEISISFKGKADPKYGSSVGLPCALLLEGLYTGDLLDPGYACSGGIVADGTIRPVGGMMAKLVAAVSSKCRLFGMPSGNEVALRDFMLLQGPASLVNLQVFGLEKVDDAMDVGRQGRRPSVQMAIDEFTKITKAAPAGSNINSWLKLPAVARQLQKVLSSEPRHLSAKLLLEFSMGKGPSVYSPEGSMDRLIAGSTAIRADFYDMAGSGRPFEARKIEIDVTGLKKLKPVIHPDFRQAVERMIVFGERRLAHEKKYPRPAMAPTEIENQMARLADDMNVAYHDLWRRFRAVDEGND